MNASATFRLTALTNERTRGREANDRTMADTAEPGAELSDEVLMARLGDGSREALALLFRRHARIVRGVAYRVLRDQSEADDLLQDVFMLIYRLCRNFDPEKGQARSWILQMTFRRAISRRRYLNSRHFYSHVDLDEVAEAAIGSPPGPDCLDGHIGQRAMQAMFDALSEQQRQTLRLFFFEGCTLAEIAAKLGQTTGNISHHYYRGLEKLRRQIFGGKLQAK